MRARSPDTSLTQGLRGSGGVHAIDVEGVGVDIRRQRAQRRGPDSIVSLRHGLRLGAVQDLSRHGDLCRLRRQDADRDAAIGIDLRRDHLGPLRAAPSAATALPRRPSRSARRSGLRECHGPPQHRRYEHRECASHRYSLLGNLSHGPAVRVSIAGFGRTRKSCGVVSCKHRRADRNDMAKVIVRDLHKRYGDVRAAQGVSFEIQDGEIFGLLGPERRRGRRPRSNA